MGLLLNNLEEEIIIKNLKDKLLLFREIKHFSLNFTKINLT